jgi:hypothetical protein
VHLLVKRNINLQNLRYTLYQHKCQAVFFPFCPVADWQWLRMVRFSKRIVNSQSHRTWAASCEFKLCRETDRVSIGSRTVIWQPLDPVLVRDVVEYLTVNDLMTAKRAMKGYTPWTRVFCSCLYCKKNLCSCFRSEEPPLELATWMSVVYELYNSSFYLISALKC